MSPTRPRPLRPPQPERRPGLIVEHIDLRPVTRDSDRFVCEIMVDAGTGSKAKWITCGRVKIQFPDRGGARPAVLSARAAYGVTDFEHDSPYIFQIPIVGFHVSFIEDGMTYVECTIGGNAEDLRVPTIAGYDPTKLPGAYVCKDKACEEHHAVVPEGYFAGPPASQALWQNLVSRRLEIVYGPVHAEDAAEKIKPPTDITPTPAMELFNAKQQAETLVAENAELRERVEGQAKQLREIREACNGSGQNPLSKHVARVFHALASADPKHSIVTRKAD